MQRCWRRISDSSAAEVTDVTNTVLANVTHVDMDDAVADMDMVDADTADVDTVDAVSFDFYSFFGRTLLLYFV